MIFFLDCEASSLLPGSFPIEVAWVDEHGSGESHLIRPEPTWLEMPEAWSLQSEAVHGIALATLLSDGVPAGRVAARAVDVLCPPDVVACSDAPAFDGFWLGILLELVELPPGCGVRMIDVRHLCGLACRRLMEMVPPSAGHERSRSEQRARNLGMEIVARAEEAERFRSRVRHRALPDAEGLWRTWRAVEDEVARVLREGWP